MKKISTLITFICTVLFGFGQEDLYTALKSNGLNTKYREYSSTLKEDGTCNLYSYITDKFLLELEQIPSGEYVAFSLLWEIEPTNGGRYRAGEDALSDYGREPNYPDVPYIYHSYRKDGYVVVDGIIYKLEGISEDGLSFKNISRLYIPDKKKSESIKEEKKDGEKKKSFKDKMKALKNAYVESATEGALPKEARELQKINLKAKITTYLLEMQTKYKEHSNSPEVIQAQKNIKKARENKDAYFKAYNDSIKATPEYQKALRARNAREGKSSSASTFTIKNTTGKSVKVGNGSGSSYQLDNGSTYEVNCGYPIYIMELNESKTTWRTGSLISDGKNVCGKTITF